MSIYFYLDVLWYGFEGRRGVLGTWRMMEMTFLDPRRFFEGLMESRSRIHGGYKSFWAIETVYQESFAHFLEADSKTEGSEERLSVYMYKHAWVIGFNTCLTHTYVL
ncbi:hypothetical protein QQ045_018854 [Rhodiola kirilowii]